MAPTKGKGGDKPAGGKKEEKKPASAPAGSASKPAAAAKPSSAGTSKPAASASKTSAKPAAAKPAAAKAPAAGAKPASKPAAAKPASAKAAGKPAAKSAEKKPSSAKSTASKTKAGAAKPAAKGAVKKGAAAKTTASKTKAAAKAPAKPLIAKPKKNVPVKQQRGVGKVASKPAVDKALKIQKKVGSNFYVMECCDKSLSVTVELINDSLYCKINGRCLCGNEEVCELELENLVGSKLNDKSDSGSSQNLSDKEEASSNNLSESFETERSSENFSLDSDGNVTL